MSCRDPIPPSSHLSASSLIPHRKRLRSPVFDRRAVFPEFVITYVTDPDASLAHRGMNASLSPFSCPRPCPHQNSSRAERLPNPGVELGGAGWVGLG